MLHAGTNIVNEVYDVRKGVDTITQPAGQPRARQGPAEASGPRSLIAGTFFGLAVAGRALPDLAARPAIVGPGLLGLVGGYGYTAPPLQYKYHALGVPLVFLLMGPLMVRARTSR